MRMRVTHPVRLLDHTPEIRAIAEKSVASCGRRIAGAYCNRPVRFPPGRAKLERNLIR